MDEAEFEQLWADVRRALEVASRAGDAEGVLQIVDAWIARWRDIEPLPHAVASLHAVAWAVDAYANVTVLTKQVEETREAVAAARRLARSIRPRDRKIDAHLARALRNLAFDEATLDARLAIVQEIRFLSTRHARRAKGIDEQLSAALVILSREVGRGSPEHVDLLNELGELLKRWPASVGIAGRYAAELWNAYACDGLEAEAKDLLAELESIRDALPGPHADLEAALAYFRAEVTSDPRGARG